MPWGRQHAGSWRNRPLHRKAAVRLDLESDRQHRRAVRIPLQRRLHRVSVQPGSGQIQAGADRHAGEQLRAQCHRSGLPLPADVADQHRCSTAGCRGVSSPPATSSTTTTSTRPCTSTRTCRPAESAYTGVDNRPRWVATAAFPACITSGGPFGTGGQAGPCVTRLNNAVGNSVTADYVIKNQNQNHSWNIAGSRLEDDEPRLLGQGRVQLRRLEEHGRAIVNRRQLVGVGEPDRVRPEQSAAGVLAELARRAGVPADHLYPPVLLVRGSTTVSAFYEGHPSYNLIPGTSTGQTSANGSYIFSGDANGDGQTNDLIYIPREHHRDELQAPDGQLAGRTPRPIRPPRSSSTSRTTRTCRSHRGQYAERGGVFYPWVNRIDLSIIQDVFHSVKGRRHTGQIRLDVTNFGNLLNHNWGVGTRLINPQILTSPSADANGALTYNLQTLERQPVDEPVSDLGGPRRRLWVDAEFPLHVQLVLETLECGLAVAAAAQHEQLDRMVKLHSIGVLYDHDRPISCRWSLAERKRHLSDELSSAKPSCLATVWEQESEDVVPGQGAVDHRAQLDPTAHARRHRRGVRCLTVASGPCLWHRDRRVGHAIRARASPQCRSAGTRGRRARHPLHRTRGGLRFARSLHARVPRPLPTNARERARAPQCRRPRARWPARAAVLTPMSASIRLVSSTSRSCASSASPSAAPSTRPSRFRRSGSGSWSATTPFPISATIFPSA